MSVTLKGQSAVYEGVSTDTKPTDADNNAIFKELDTGIRYYYDGTDWNEIPKSGGGGGSGTDNYNELSNKPSINGTVLSGNKSLDNLGIQAELIFDDEPTEDSTNPVQSGGVYTALAGKADEDNVYRLALTDSDLLPINTDLDNVMTVGCYYAYANADVLTITNRPVTDSSAFRLMVDYGAGKNRPRQTYKRFNSYDTYVRNTNSSNVWSAWKKVEDDLSTFATATQGGKADTAIQGIKVNSSTVNPDSNKVVSITVPTSAADVSALPDTTKYAAALSLTINSSTFVMTGQLKDQNGDNLGTAQTIDLPLESVVVGGSYDSQTKKVVLTLQNGNTIEFSVADLVSGLQTELSASNKLNPAYINYDSTHRAVSDTEKSIWNGKQNALTFDGTYSASTNKAATVSTVTNAVNALDVTGDASVSASKTISAWSETDGKVSISTQDIAIAGTQAVLTGYTPESPAQTDSIVATDTVNAAIKKLDERSRVDENNILSEQQKTTGMGTGGSNYIQVNGIKMYFDTTAPTGASVGDLWVGG